MTTARKEIDAARICIAIEQLQKYLGADDIASLIAVLEAMKRDPGDGAQLDRLAETFNGLGIMQGAVLTYTPYLAVILSHDPFNDPA